MTQRAGCRGSGSVRRLGSLPSWTWVSSGSFWSISWLLQDVCCPPTDNGQRLVYIEPLQVKDHYILYCEGELHGKQIRMAKLVGEDHTSQRQRPPSPRGQAAKCLGSCPGRDASVVGQRSCSCSPSREMPRRVPPGSAARAPTGCPQLPGSAFPPALLPDQGPPVQPHAGSRLGGDTPQVCPSASCLLVSPTGRDPENNQEALENFQEFARAKGLKLEILELAQSGRKGAFARSCPVAPSVALPESDILGEHSASDPGFALPGAI